MRKPAAILFLSTMACLFPASLTVGAPTAIAPIFATVTGPDIAEILQKSGYKAELSIDAADDPLLRSAAQGVNFAIYFYDCRGTSIRRCGSIQYSAAFDVDESKQLLEKMNEWNTSYRYTKAWLDEVGDPFLQMDVSVTGGITPDAIEESLDIWHAALGTFVDHIEW